MKILYITTVSETMNFFKSFIGELVKEGHTVDIATNDSLTEVNPVYREYGSKIFTLSCVRSPLNAGNLKAIGEIRSIVTEGNYDLVHCHTPIAAAVTRLALKGLRKRSEHPVKVLYTAHGFHFYKGAPIKNWLIYYPVEKLCAHYTDVLITINVEDHQRAQKKLAADRIEYVPGVGINADRFLAAVRDNSIRSGMRAELGIPEDALLLLSVGELNANKNHLTAIRALSSDVLRDKRIYYIIAGTGDKKSELEAAIEQLGLGDRVRLLGYRRDVPELLAAADVYLLPSLREGLNVSLMEAMASARPCICGRIRGNVDLIDEGKGGFAVDPASPGEWAAAIAGVSAMTAEDRRSMGLYNSEKIRAFTFDTVNKKMKEIYRSIVYDHCTEKD